MILIVPYGSVYSYIKKFELLPNTDFTRQKYLTSKRCLLTFCTKEELIELYSIQKKSIYEIADIYSINYGTVYKRLNEFEIPRRTKSENGILNYTKPGKRERQRELANTGQIGIFRNFDYKETKPEKIFMKWYEANQIDYVYQFKIYHTGHYYDFLLKDTNIIIEIDGEYWHNTEEQQIKDRYFDSEAIEHGYIILRFTDKEIQKTKTTCFERIKDPYEQARNKEKN